MSQRLLYLSLLLLSFSTNVFSQIATTVNLTGNASTLSIPNNTATVVDDALVISANGILTNFTVTITGSYVNGDILAYNGSLPTGISAVTFNTTTRSLVFEGSANASVWQEFLRRVTLQTVSATCYQEQRQVSFVVGKKYYNISNGHFYELSSPIYGWKNALTYANSQSYFGRLGYMVTITSQAENNFIFKIIGNNTWIGASDDATTVNNALGTSYYTVANNTQQKQNSSSSPYSTYLTTAEGNWYWISGPEKGTQISAGNHGNSGYIYVPSTTSVPVAVNGQYMNWSANEPNNWNWKEHYAHMWNTDPDPSVNGKWNDWSNNIEVPTIVEYGGSASDNTTSNPVSTRNLIIIGAPSGTISGGNINVCAGAQFTLTHSGLTAGGSIVRWESSFDNFLTNPVTISNTATTLTTSISQTNYYRAVVNNSGCTNLVTSSTKITLNGTSGGTIFPASLTYCSGGYVDLTLNNNSGSIVKWQVSTSSTFASGITDIQVSTPTLSYIVTGSSTYYFRAVLSNCGSAYYSTTATATSNSGNPPIGGTIADVSFCGGASNGGTLTLSGYTGTINKWQKSIDGGTQWTDISHTAANYGFTGISSTTKYRAIITNGGSCGTATSGVGTVNVNQSPVGGTTSGSASSACSGTNSTVLTLNNYVGTIQWQSSTTSTSTGFTNINNATINTFTASNVSATTYYRAVVSSGTCTAVNSSVFTLTYYPSPSISGTFSTCVGSTSSLSGTATAATGSPWLSGNTAIATVSNTGVVTGQAVGNATITYTNSNGCQAAESFTVNASSSASLTSANGTNAQTVNVNNNIVAITYTISGGGAVTFSNLPSGVSGNYDAGTSTATISGAPIVSGVFTYALNLTCGTTTGTITVRDIPVLSNFPPITKYFYDGSFTLIPPTSSSPGAFTYESSNTNVATISGSTITFISPGTTTITATQAQTALYQSATTSFLLTVNGVTVTTRSGQITTTNLNYVSSSGALNTKKGEIRNGQIVIASTSAEIQTVSILNSGTVTATGSVISDGGSTITARGFCWSTTTNPTIENSITSESGTTGALTSTINGLSNGTTYYFRAYITNSSGTSYGNELSFTTTVGAPTVTTTAITAVNSSSANSGGSVTALGGSALTAVGVCWSTAANPTIANSITNNGTTASFTSNLTGLTAGTTYYVRAYATNSSGTSYGNELSFTTPAVAPTLTTTAISSISASSANSGGTVTATGGASITSQGVCWSTTATPTISNSFTSNGTSTPFTSNLTGLVAGTTYYVRAYATNSAGTSYGNELNFTTSVGSPTVTTTAITAISANSANSGGVVTSTGGAAITAQGVCWYTTANPTTANSLTNNGTTTPFTSNLTGLAVGTTYYVRAYATNSIGTTYGNELSFTTSAVAPTVTTTAINTITASSANSGGTVTATGGAALTAVGVCWSTTANPTTANSITNNGTSTPFTSNLTGLTAGTTYYVRAYATNSAGTSYGNELSFTLSGVGPSVTTEDITSITSSSASSGGTVTATGGSALTSVGICWSTTTNPTIANSITNNGTTASFTSDMTGLVGGTTYYVRAYATNGAGTSYGDELSFTTLAVAPTVTTTALSAITASSATSGGEVTVTGGATITTQGVCWSTSQNPTTALPTKTSDGTATPFTSSMTGLAAGTTYYVRAYATNSVGTSYGNELSFTTLAAPSLTTTAISSIAVTSATSGGTVTVTGGATITTQGVCWSTSQNPTTALPTKTSDGTASPFTSNITGLAAGTTYYLRAYATNSVGTSYGNELSFTTLAAPTLTTTAISSIAGTSATSGGTVTATGGAAITVQGVCWSTSQNPTTALPTKTSDGTSSPFTSNMTGLAAGTTYYLRAYATNSVGTSYGNELSFTTLAAPTLTTTAISSIAGTSATSGGTVTSTGGATITVQGVCWSTSVNPTTSLPTKTTDGTTSPFTSNMTPLLEGTTYYVRAYATNSVGTSYGNELSFTTTAATPTVTTTAISSIAANSANSGGTVTSSGGSALTAVGVCWSTSQNPTIANSNTNNGTSTSFTSSLTGLTFSTTYYVRAYATNAAGTSYGNQVSFVTTAPVSNTPTFTSSITVNGTTVDYNIQVSDYGTSPVTECGFYYSYNTKYTDVTSFINSDPGEIKYTVSNNSNNGLPITGTVPSTGTSSITFLIANYYFIPYVTNSQGTTFGTRITLAPNWPTVSINGKLWSQANLGASRVATSSTDANSYGFKYQWGRASDGHQFPTSGTTSTYSDGPSPSHGSFILSTLQNGNWMNQNPSTTSWAGTTAINNPCPSGWRIPTRAEWVYIIDNTSGGFNAGSAWSTSLGIKLPSSQQRMRNNGSLSSSNNHGYWLNNSSSGGVQMIHFGDSSWGEGNDAGAYGAAVRCIQD
jgi:uncharacterized protein (TIGR02145 family)